VNTEWQSVVLVCASHRVVRLQVNPKNIAELEKAGLEFVGRDETGDRMEIVELAKAVHPYYVGTQYHPEFKSRPFKPSPPFYGLLLAASGQALLPHHSWSTVAPPETRTLIQGGAAGKPTWLMDES
jgi:CTP synthase (UTP-ammonia lyase)